MGGMWISLVVPGVVVVVVAVVEVGIPEAAAVVTASVMNVGSLATLPGSVGCSEVMEVREAEGVEVPVLNIEEAQVMDAGKDFLSFCIVNQILLHVTYPYVSFVPIFLS